MAKPSLLKQMGRSRAQGGNSTKKQKRDRSASPLKNNSQFHIEEPSPNSFNPRNCKIISLFNHKGGVGKTSLTMNLAYSAALKGNRTLIVDADSQCNITSFFRPTSSRLTPMVDDGTQEEYAAGNYDIPKDVTPSNLEGVVYKGKSIYEAVKKAAGGNPNFVQNEFNVYKVRNISRAEDGRQGDLLLLPGGYNLNFLDGQLSYHFESKKNPDACGCFKYLFTYLAKTYNLDFIFVDVGPSAGTLNKLILFGCDLVIPVVFPDAHSYNSLNSLMTSVFPNWVTSFNNYNSEVKEKEGSDYVSVFGTFPKIGPLVCSNYRFNLTVDPNVGNELQRKKVTIEHSKIVLAMKNLMLSKEVKGNHVINSYLTYASSSSNLELICACPTIGSVILGECNNNKVLIVERSDQGGIASRIENLLRDISGLLNQD